MQTVSVQELIDAGVHFGCRVSRWNPKMAPYIYGRRNLIHIMDLRETLRGLLRAQNFLYHTAEEGHQILWVGTKRQVKGVIHDAGQRTGMPVVTERWIGGTLTNFSVIRSRLRRLEELEAMEEDGTMASHSKKMISTLRRERRKIERNLGGIREMTTLPGALVVVDPGREVNSVKEARRLGVPVVGILDTDCDPTLVDIVIPGNDDALKSVRLLVERLVLSVEEGCANRREQAAAVGGEPKGEALAPGDEPRPTRTLRPLPKGLKPAAAGEETSGAGVPGSDVSGSDPSVGGGPGGEEAAGAAADRETRQRQSQGAGSTREPAQQEGQQATEADSQQATENREATNPEATEEVAAESHGGESQTGESRA